MNIYYKENEIIKPCLTVLRGLLGLDVVIQTELAGKKGLDFKLTLPTKPPLQLAGECKANIPTIANALYFLFQAKRYGGKVILFTKWIPDAVAQKLREAGIYFVDAVGNAYLRHPPQILIDIRGRRPARRLEPEPGRLLELGGLKIINFLLLKKELVNEPDRPLTLREIARNANVALGTAHKVMQELMLARMLLPGPNGTRRFGDIKEMVDTFVRGYALKLRPQCLIGRYRHKNNHPAKILNAFQERLKNTKAEWALTGGLAAKELDEHFEPDMIALFVDEKAEKELKKEPMLPDQGGNIILLRLFAPTAIGRPEAPGFPPLATPLLVYAELLNDGGPREAEAASLIYDKRING